MPSYSRKVKIPGKTSQELYDKVSQDLDRLLSKISPTGYKVDRNASAKNFSIKSTLFSATLVCQEAEMELNVSLSLMALPFRSKVDEGITRWLSKTFDLGSAPLA